MKFLTRAIGAVFAVAAVSATLLVTPSSGSPGKDPNLARAENYVAKHCPSATREVSAHLWSSDFGFNALYGNCRAGDGRDQHIWFFINGRFVRVDAPASSHFIIGLYRDNRTIAFLYVLYRQTDAECCPTGGGTIVRYHWDGKGVRRLDPLPPRAFSPGVRTGR